MEPAALPRAGRQSIAWSLNVVVNVSRLETFPSHGSVQAGKQLPSHAVPLFHSRSPQFARKLIRAN